jgi:predicted O-methyltransferase YrrM
MRYELRFALERFQARGVYGLLHGLRRYARDFLAARRLARAEKPGPDDPDAVVRFAYTAAGGLIAPGQIDGELLRLAHLVQERRPDVVVEIGTANGGTLFCFARLSAPHALLVSIDLPGGVHGGGYPAWKRPLYRSFARDGQRIELLRGDSHSDAMRQRLESLLGGRPIDLLMIDGDHTYDGVRADYELYTPLVRPGGLVVFHDIRLHPPEIDCHVDRLWAEVRGAEGWEILDGEADWAGLGILPWTGLRPTHRT